MADPLFSAGARLERKALRSYLRRQIKMQMRKKDYTVGPSVYGKVLDWVLGREKRYSKKPGGL